MPGIVKSVDSAGKFIYFRKLSGYKIVIGDHRTVIIYRNLIFAKPGSSIIKILYNWENFLMNRNCPDRGSVFASSFGT